MSYALVLASADRAGDHLVIFGALVATAAVGALVYGLVRLVKRRSGSTQSTQGTEADCEEA